MTKPRNLPDTITAMLALIPETERGLISKLESVRNGAHYTAPEAMGSEWRKVQAVLVEHLGFPAPGWQTEVAEVFRG